MSFSGMVVSVFNRVPDVSGLMREEVKAALLDAGLECEADTKAATPVDTGNLRASYKTRVEDAGMSVSVGTNVEYAPPVEFGTASQAAQPHLVPSAEAAQKRLVARLKRIEKELS